MRNFRKRLETLSRLSDACSLIPCTNQLEWESNERQSSRLILVSQSDFLVSPKD